MAWRLNGAGTKRTTLGQSAATKCNTSDSPCTAAKCHITVSIATGFAPHHRIRYTNLPTTKAGDVRSRTGANHRIVVMCLVRPSQVGQQEREAALVTEMPGQHGTGIHGHTQRPTHLRPTFASSFTER